MDREDLIDKEVMLVTSKNSILGIVVAADTELGITIVEKADRNRYLLCQKVGRDKTPKLFDYIISGIENGEITTKSITDISPLAIFSGPPIASDCVFNK